MQSSLASVLQALQYVAGITPEEVRSNMKHAEVVTARWCYYYLGVRFLGHRQARVARFVQHDRASVAYCLKSLSPDVIRNADKCGDVNMNEFRWTLRHTHNAYLRIQAAPTVPAGYAR